MSILCGNFFEYVDYNRQKYAELGHEKGTKNM